MLLTQMTIQDVQFIDTSEAIRELVDWISLQDTWLGELQPPLYIDLEGERLGRNGNISLMTLMVCPGKDIGRIHIIDVHKLQDDAFQTKGRRAMTLRTILESKDVLKVFFDVRNDSDALHFHYGIKLDGVRDVQLMESAKRQTTASRKYISSLNKCIESILWGPERDTWRRCKANGEKAWNPSQGGSYAAFTTRPLPQDITAYCAGDVQWLPKLYFTYNCGTTRWQELVARQSQLRVAQSHRAGYEPYGADRARSPWTAAENKLLDSWAEVNPVNDYFSFPADDELYNSAGERHDWYDEDDHDYEDWTRCEWQGPPS